MSLRQSKLTQHEDASLIMPRLGHRHLVIETSASTRTERWSQTAWRVYRRSQYTTVNCLVKWWETRRFNKTCQRLKRPHAPRASDQSLSGSSIRNVWIRNWFEKLLVFFLHQWVATPETFECTLPLMSLYRSLFANSVSATGWELIEPIIVFLTKRKLESIGEKKLSDRGDPWARPGRLKCSVRRQNAFEHLIRIFRF